MPGKIKIVSLSSVDILFCVTLTFKPWQPKKIKTSQDSSSEDLIHFWTRSWCPDHVRCCCDTLRASERTSLKIPALNLGPAPRRELTFLPTLFRAERVRDPRWSQRRGGRTAASPDTGHSCVRSPGVCRNSRRWPGHTGSYLTPSPGCHSGRLAAGRHKAKSKNGKSKCENSRMSRIQGNKYRINLGHSLGCSININRL